MADKPTPEHGTYACYRQGCRRPECRKANADEERERRNRRLTEPVPEHVHGTRGGYTNWSCRCDDCTEAHRDYRIRKGYAKGILPRRFFTPQEDILVLESDNLKELALRLDRSAKALSARRSRLLRGGIDSDGE